MSKVLVTGSSDGLGLMAAQRLLAAGHEVVLHGRNSGRARDAQTAAPKARGVVVGDLASIAETRALAEQANRLGPFDAVIHNAGVGDRERRIETVDGLEHIFAINVLAPYLLTALIDVLLAFAMARRWPDVRSNAVDPGWVATKMGGRGAPDDLEQGSETQVWLAVSQDAAAMVSGAYFYHKKRQSIHPVASDATIQDRLLAACEELTGTPIPL
ncbi:MAG: SDR family NAD(P)-dependent oxidoreductase [Chloroflexi bacterium]|nr:MAG: SDR family NAD(P)-dependent oxidoreductase [Chloroflexota bacterium]